MAKALIYLFMFALALYCVTDVLSSDDHRRAGTPKFMWVIIVCIPILGGIVWLVFISARKTALRHGSAPMGSTGPYNGNRTSGSRSGAPDDDPEFLWKLAAEQRRKREAEERRKREAEERRKNSSNTPEDNEGDEPNPEPGQ